MNKVLVGYYHLPGLIVLGAAVISFTDRPTAAAATVRNTVNFIIFDWWETKEVEFVTWALQGSADGRENNNNNCVTKQPVL